ncbi:predicted protein [Lichtheimia corymbifera JMRC:FSU:9682]|uniref:Uncharacterized protein n=1 Tax=Lichtheimia corymbifera JMRC:FSU:9682 TaxID=1263082 RepID=A0A068RL03_9FUNG|nr:predicted protein [Lichtheimia corymbifera JMRC:FSU:9682]
MTIVFSIKRNRSSSALRSSTSGHDLVPSFQEPAASFLSSKPKSIFSKLVSSSSPSSTTLGEHRRRSSITSILQSCFRNTDRDTFGRQRNNSNGANAFENDALFERYRYQTQHQRKRSDHRPLFADNNQRTKDNEDGEDDDEDDDDDPPPRVICYQEEEQQRRSILVNRSGHRHTTSLQMPGGSSCLNNNSTIHHHPSSSAIHHRRSKTATHIRHYSHISYISSSNITAHSGDLTAKEFADIAGIRILPDDESSSNSDSNNVQPCCCHEDERDYNRRDSLAHMLEEQETNDISLPATTTARNINTDHPISNSSLYVDEQRGSRFSSSDEYNQTTTADTTTTLPPPPPPPSTGTTHKPHIWDNAFWRQPHVGGMDNFFSCTKNDAEKEAIVTTSPDSTYKALIPPVVQEMRSRNSTVFKKGRFEVHVESL